MDNSPQVCPLCEATINPASGSANEVRFSAGALGSRAKLWARVCQYAQERGGCINSNAALRSEPQPTDFYGETPSIELPPKPAES